MWSIFRRKPQTFDLAQVPSLDLRQGFVTVDIGYLAHDAHTDAFARIFEKLLHDNESAFAGWTLNSIVAAQPIKEAPSALLPSTSFEVLLQDAQRAARVLCHSHNDKVRLDFGKEGKTKKLYVTFDNPSFDLE